MRYMFALLPLTVSFVLNFTSVSSPQIFCRACAVEKYSLNKSSVIIHETMATFRDSINCLKCPYGAECESGIWNNAGFWGSQHEALSSVNMYPCPQDYCEQNTASLVAYDYCADGRTGTLCGRCKDGLSESLFGTDCIPDENCGWQNWTVALMIAVYGVLYVLFFMFEEDYSKLVDYLSGKVQRKSTPAEREGKEMSDAGYFQIFMYYIQTSQLLQVKIIITEDESFAYLHRPEDVLPGYIVEGVSSLFSFDGLAFGKEACLSEGMTPVMKTAWSSAFVLYLFAVLFLFYVLSGFCCCCLAPKKRPRIGVFSMSERMLTTFVMLFLYTYQEIAENALLLLNCTKVDGISVLFHDGNVTCLQSWQYGVIVMVRVFVLPFFTILLFGPRLLEVGRISLLFFLLSFIFPLVLAVPMIIYFVELYRGKTPTISEQTRHRRADKTICCGEKDAKLTETLVDVITGSYRTDILGGVCWEGVINFRRMVLVLLFTFVNDVLLKQIFLSLGCFLILLVHLRAMPFKQRFSNIFESVSLSMLIVISATNLVKAAFYYTQTIPRGAAYFVMIVFEWIEALALGILPVCIIILLVLSLVVRAGSALAHKGNNDSSHIPKRRPVSRYSEATPNSRYDAAMNRERNVHCRWHMRDRNVIPPGRSPYYPVHSDSSYDTQASSWYNQSDRSFLGGYSKRLAFRRYTSPVDSRFNSAPDYQLYPPR